MPPRRARLAALYAWLSGAAFAASLVYFLYVYLVRLGRPPEAPLGAPGTWRAALVNGLLFGAFALHHSVMARTGVKRLLPPHLERATYVWVASVLFIGVCAAWREVPGVLYETRGAPAWIARGVQLAGLLLIAAAARRLDPLDLAGIRQAREASAPPPVLRADGPYRLVRHPLYLGWMLLVFGAGTMTASRFVFALVSSVYLLIAVPWEERSLREAFGEQYLRYAERVRWRILPGVY